jgi:hypothetical protein
MGCAEAYDLTLAYLDKKLQQYQSKYNDEYFIYTNEEPQGWLKAIEEIRTEWIENKKSFIYRCIQISGGSNV